MQSTEGSYGLWRAADVICHELAHQWFGNLVTAATWQDLTGADSLLTQPPVLAPEEQAPVEPAAQCALC